MQKLFFIATLVLMVVGIGVGGALAHEEPVPQDPPVEFYFRYEVDENRYELNDRHTHLILVPNADCSEFKFNVEVKNAPAGEFTIDIKYSYNKVRFNRFSTRDLVNSDGDRVNEGLRIRVITRTVPGTIRISGSNLEDGHVATLVFTSEGTRESDFETNANLSVGFGKFTTNGEAQSISGDPSRFLLEVDLIENRSSRLAYIGGSDNRNWTPVFFNPNPKHSDALTLEQSELSAPAAPRGNGVNSASKVTTTWGQIKTRQ